MLHYELLQRLTPTTALSLSSSGIAPGARFTAHNNTSSHRKYAVNISVKLLFRCRFSSFSYTVTFCFSFLLLCISGAKAYLFPQGTRQVPIVPFECNSGRFRVRKLQRSFSRNYWNCMEVGEWRWKQKKKKTNRERSKTLIGERKRVTFLHRMREEIETWAKAQSSDENFHHVKFAIKIKIRNSGKTWSSGMIANFALQQLLIKL